MEVFSNIVEQQTLRKVNIDTLKIIRDAVATSFGPYGSSSQIKIGDDTLPKFTKDGYTILMNLKFNGIIETSLKEVMEDLTRHVVKEVGDGTTSATLLSYAIFKRFVTMEEPNDPEVNYEIFKSMPPVEIEKAFKKVVKRLNEIITQHKRTIENAKDITLRSSIELRDITFHYPDSDTLILDKANMTIPVGSSVGIIGASGAGKTTAVDIILGLLKPQEGQVLVDGEDVLLNKAGWLNHIGYIPQVIFMLDATIRENIVFGSKVKDVDDKILWNALEDAQLAEFIRSLPEGLETTIGERGVRLSGGQRQRIGIARALYRNPDVLVFDEATSALDNETEEAIMESINSLHGKKTMIIIAHRLTTIKECDLVFRVENGKITT